MGILITVNGEISPSLFFIRHIAKGTCIYVVNHISGLMVNMLTSSVVDRVFEPWLGQAKD